MPLTSCLTGLDLSVLQIITNNVSCHTADSKPVKQEVNGTELLPPLLFSAFSISLRPQPPQGRRKPLKTSFQTQMKLKTFFLSKSLKFYHFEIKILFFASFL